MTKEQEEAIEYIKESFKATVTHKEKLEIILSMLEEKDKQIDLILDKFIEGTGNYCSEFEYMNKEEVKQYFENKAKEAE